MRQQLCFHTKDKDLSFEISTDESYSALDDIIELEGIKYQYINRITKMDPSTGLWVIYNFNPCAAPNVV